MHSSLFQKQKNYIRVHGVKSYFRSVSISLSPTPTPQVTTFIAFLYSSRGSLCKNKQCHFLSALRPHFLHLLSSPKNIHLMIFE